MPSLLVPVEGLLPGTVGLGPGEALEAVVPDLFGTRTGFMEDNFSADRGRGWRNMGGGFRMIQMLYMYCALYLLHQLHLRSSGIRPGRLGTPVLEGVALFYVCTGFFFFPF